MNGEGRPRIEVNGREYASVDDMPPDVRRLYEQAMRRLQERGPGEPGAPPETTGSPETPTTVRTTRRLVVNGKEISSLDELPENMRELARRALAAAGEADTVVVGDEPPLEVRSAAGPGERRGTVITDRNPMVVGAKPAREQPVFAEWMKRDQPRRRVRVRVSPVRLAFWIGLVILIVYLWLRRH